MARDNTASSQAHNGQQDMPSFLAAAPYEEGGARSGNMTADNAGASSVPSSTGPVGEPGLPPARPSSNASASRIGISAGPANRSAVPPSSAGGRSSYQFDPSPPPTSTSRTHVPNVISSAFLGPISSKRTQQDQPSQRPMSPPIQQPSRRSNESAPRSHRHRNSNASIVTVDGQQKSRPLVDPDAPPVPTSRGTDGTANTPTRETQPNVNRINSMESGASNMPLQSSKLPLNPLQLPGRTTSASLRPAKSPKSPTSLTPSWGRGSRPHEPNTSREGHTKLASAPPSPLYPSEKKFESHERVDVGRNYEYFSGNAVFLLSGRLINARQRPLNLLTALLAILPAVLFFIFSYVPTLTCLEKC